MQAYVPRSIISIGMSIEYGKNLLSIPNYTNMLFSQYPQHNFLKFFHLGI